MKSNKIILLLLTLSFFAFKNSKINPAVTFLNSLNKDQKSIALLDFDDPLKDKWHYLPHSMFIREGISLKELQPKQKKLFFNLLKSSLSESGYNKTLKIINLETVLAEISGDPVFRDSEKYYATFYGNPETDKIWSWSFEGHHISLNFTISGENTSIAPRFFGANPTTISSGKRKGERTLDKEDDLGLEFVNTLNDNQKQKTIIKDVPFKDIFTKNKSEVSPLETVGIPFKDLNKSQQELLLQLINIHIESMPEKVATIRLKKIEKEGFNNIHFTWFGATQIDKPHYYRIQGKSFLVEFDNSQNNAKHIHVVWRDFNGDFGKNLIKAHYIKSH
ncbi:MAG: DUF3500 domain-containing protein [Algibacter sp.]